MRMRLLIEGGWVVITMWNFWWSIARPSCGQVGIASCELEHRI